MLKFVTVLPILAIGAIILAAGILKTRSPQESPRNALAEVLYWGLGLILCDSIELLFL